MSRVIRRSGVFRVEESKLWRIWGTVQSHPIYYWESGSGLLIIAHHPEAMCRLVRRHGAKGPPGSPLSAPRSGNSRDRRRELRARLRALGLLRSAQAPLRLVRGALNPRPYCNEVFTSLGAAP